MTDRPFSLSISLVAETLSAYDNHIIRRLSEMKGQYLDRQAYERMLEAQDAVMYQVYEITRPPQAGELAYGISIVHPGTVGDEFFMTKGHFHAVLETAEVYYGLKGAGVMVMETLEGDWAVENIRPGTVLYVPPRWAHRSVNTAADQDLVTLFLYPANAGHDYGTIEQHGFRKLIIKRDGRVDIVDNPRWRGPQR